MSVTYRGLWEILIRRRMRKTEFAKGAGIDQNILAKLGKNKYVSLKTIERICDFLDCDVGDIVGIDRGEPDVEEIDEMSFEQIEDFLFGGNDQ